MRVLCQPGVGEVRNASQEQQQEIGMVSEDAAGSKRVSWRNVGFGKEGVCRPGLLMNVSHASAVHVQRNEGGMNEWWEDRAVRRNERERMKAAMCLPAQLLLCALCCHAPGRQAVLVLDAMLLGAAGNSGDGAGAG